MAAKQFRENTIENAQIYSNALNILIITAVKMNCSLLMLKFENLVFNRADFLAMKFSH